MALRSSRDRDERGSSGAKFRYKERSADAVKKRADQDGGNFDSIFKSGIDTFRPKQGDNVIRFLPPTWEDPEHYGYDVWVHGYVGADNGSYLCPAKMLKKACPICEAQKEAAEAGEEEEAKSLKATKKVAAWIIDRNENKPTPQIWLMGWTMDRDIAALCHSDRTGKVLMLDNPDTGYDLSFKRTGQLLNTRYFGMAVDRDSTPLMDAQKDTNRLMEFVTENAIPDILAYKDAAYLTSIIEGSGGKKDPDEEEEDEKPARRRAARDPEEEDEKPSRRRRAEPEEEEEKPKRRRADPDEEEEEKPSRRRADPEEEEDEKPRRRRAEPEEEEDEKPRRRRADPEEEEEEKPSRRRRAEPEEEEDEKPRRRRAEPEPEEEEEKPKRRRAEPEEEEDEKPRRRREPEPEEEEDESPAVAERSRKKKRKTRSQHAGVADLSTNIIMGGRVRLPIFLSPIERQVR